MNSEKLQKWALVAEVIGGIAVVLSLLFVAVQVSQSSDSTDRNTRTMEVNAYQDLVSQIMEMNFEIMGNPQLSELYSRVQDCGPFQSRAEESQMGLYVTNLIRHGDMAYHQYEKGLIDSARLRNAMGIVISQIQRFYPMNSAWTQRKTAGSIYPAFQDYVDQFVISDSRQDRPCPQIQYTFGATNYN
jgi:hypothetical protein